MGVDTMAVGEHEVLRRVGRYEIVREIGRGASATVYLARQTDLDRYVALKELAGSHAADPAFVERFLRESRLVGSLNHPNVVTVHEYFEHDGTGYIAMEYFERGSLRPYVGSLSLAQTAGVLEGLLAGLAHAEGRGIVHRDLKPENVMVTSTGTVKIADFGVAKALEAEGPPPLTLSGTTVGTPAYMAPEQAMAQSVGRATDLYAVGVIAYELLTGDVPYRESDVALGILLQHLNDPVPSARTANPDVDPVLSAWVERLLAKEPADRPPGAADAWEALDEIVVDLLGPRWGRQSRLTESGASAVAADSRRTAVTAKLAPRIAPRRRRRWFAALVGVLALVALAAGVFAAVTLTDGEQALGTSPETTSSITTTDRSEPRPVAGPAVTRVHVEEVGDEVVLTLDTSGPSLRGRRVVLRDADLSDGRAWFEVRAPDITTKTRGGEVGPLAVLVRKAPNRLRVDVAADSGSLGGLTVRRVGDRRVVIAIAKPEPPLSPAPPVGVTETSGGTTGTTTEPPTDTPKDEKPPVKTG